MARCGGHRVLRWMVAGALVGLYWLGRRERPAARQPSVEAIDEEAVTRAWVRVSRLPQFRYLWRMAARRAVRGRSRVRVLDVGSGAGQLAIALARRREVESVTGIDLSGEMVTRARHTAETLGVNAEFLQVDAAAMPFPDASFDVVVSTLSMHHWDDPIRVLSEINRVLAPGGNAIIVDLRRDASAFIFGGAAVVSRYVVPEPLRHTDEPLASFQASYTPCEAVLLAYKAGWRDPRATHGPFWMVLESNQMG